MDLVSVAASVGTGAAGSSSSGTPTFTVRNVTDNSQMLSTSLTVDANEYTSADATAAAVIDTGEDDVVTDDLIEVACTTAGTGVTYAVVTLGFQLV
jgi:transcription elongation factor